MLEVDFITIHMSAEKQKSNYNTINCSLINSEKQLHSKKPDMKFNLDSTNNSIYRKNIC